MPVTTLARGDPRSTGDVTDRDFIRRFIGDEAVNTHADDQRSFVPASRYGHILDPRTASLRTTCVGDRRRSRPHSPMPASRFTCGSATLA